MEQIVKKKVSFFKVDLCDYPALEQVFQQIPNISAVIHFAGLKVTMDS